MQVTVEIITGKENVYRAMLATMRLKPKQCNQLKNESWFKMLRAKHSPIEEYRIWVDAIVPERVHTHIVRHKEIGKYVASSRPDLDTSTDISDGLRSLSLSVNAKRLIEISEQRLCGDAWCETTEFIQAVIDNLPDKILQKLCSPQCVRCGCCIGKGCGYYNSNEYKTARIFFVHGLKHLNEL